MSGIWGSQQKTDILLFMNLNLRALTEKLLHLKRHCKKENSLDQLC